VLNVDLPDDELSARRKAWKMPPYKSDRGTLAKYIRLVKECKPGLCDGRGLASVTSISFKRRRRSPDPASGSADQR
jgi:hypothetical protein